MDVAIGVGRAFVQNKPRPSFALFAQTVIDADLCPALGHGRFLLRQSRLHGEGGDGKEEGILVVLGLFAGRIGHFYPGMLNPSVSLGESRVGKECVSTCGSWWTRFILKQTSTITNTKPHF